MNRKYMKLGEIGDVFNFLTHGETDLPTNWPISAGYQAVQSWSADRSYHQIKL
jgi:hypothetical protein